MSNIAATVGEPESGVSCSACKGPLLPSYFAVNGRHMCRQCWEAMEGSPLRPLAFGFAAAALSTGLYYAIHAGFGGFRFQLIPIVAGVLVGSAVRIGSRLYQRSWLRWYAVGMTYLATVLTYTHAVLGQGYGHSWATAIATSVTLPIIMLAQFKNVVTLVLLAFGLHEAYAFSARYDIKVRGPFDATDPDPVLGGETLKMPVAVGGQPGARPNTR